jgi:hypothetical protein
MSTVPEGTSPPAQTTGDVGRLAISGPPDPPGSESGPAPIDWDDVEREAQRAFNELADHVHQRLADVRSRAGKTTARGFALFAYRVFDRDTGADTEPVVVGIVFEEQRGANRIVVTGDIADEGSGLVWYEAPNREVAADPAAVLAAAQEVARDLARQDAVVVQQLLQPTRRDGTEQH